MPQTLHSTHVDTFFVARLYGTSSDIVVGAKSAGSQEHVAIQVDPTSAALADMNQIDSVMSHLGNNPTEAECRAFLLDLLPTTGDWGLANTNDFDSVHYYRPSGWITGQGFSFGFPVTKSGSTFKRALLVDGQALTVDYLAVVQPHV